MECGSDTDIRELGLGYILVQYFMDTEPFCKELQNEDNTVDQQDHRSNNSNNRHRLVRSGSLQCRIQGNANNVIIWKSLKYSLQI